MEAITKFRGKYRFLSNFWPAEVTLDGKLYSTTEAAYQASKTTDEAVRETIRAAESPGDAKKLGRAILFGQVRGDWDKVKLRVMRDLLEQKFAPGSELAALLIATGDAPIVEGNFWHDTFWGTCSCKNHEGVGANHLGNILMDLRARLRASCKTGGA